ncbi:MAG: hypothetical protein NT139_03205 [Candidatus Woesearchaeota archaeon]|nr:hypothetical protein [Candidatus Woesearchaeota archaeon]
MQKDVLFDRLKIKQGSVFNFDELYKSLFRWFEAYGYEFHEDEYKEVQSEKGKQIEILWTADRIFDAYVKFVIETNFFITGLVDVEVEQEGLKIKTNKATIEFRISAYLVKDYKGEWEKTGILRSLREIWDKILFRKRMEQYEDVLYEEVNNYMDEIKAFLNLYHF